MNMPFVDAMRAPVQTNCPPVLRVEIVCRENAHRSAPDCVSRDANGDSLHEIGDYRFVFEGEDRADVTISRSSTPRIEPVEEIGGAQCVKRLPLPRGLWCKVAFSRQNPKIGYLKINPLRAPTFPV